MISTYDAYTLALYSYFDLFDETLPLSLKDFKEHLFSEAYMNQQRSDLFTLMNLELAKTLDIESLGSFSITQTINENNSSGLCATIFENDTTLVLALRGSENLDTEYHRCGWEDWRDNLEIFLGITLQQLKIAQLFTQLKTDKKIILTGHSKGGNLALFLALTCDDEKYRKIEHVYTFNACGLRSDTLKSYQKRLNDTSFLAKIDCYETEHDMVSAMFKQIKQPTIIACPRDNLTLTQMLYNHQMNAFVLHGKEFEPAYRKSLYPTLFSHLVNDIIMKLPTSTLEKWIYRCNDYVHSDLSVDELYHVFIYHVGQYTKIFDKLDFNQIRQIEVKTLIDALKSEWLHSGKFPSFVHTLFDSLKQDQAFFNLFKLKTGDEINDSENTENS